MRIEAAEEMGSKEATLERIEGIETRERVRKAEGQRGGSSGVGVTSADVSGSSLLGRGVSTSSTSLVIGGVTAGPGVIFGLDSGDFFSMLLRSLPLPSTALRSDPLRLRLPFACIASDMALRPPAGCVRSGVS